MIKNIFTKTILIILILKAGTLIGQEERLKFIGIETGMEFQSCNIPEYDFIRADIPNYGYGNASNNLAGYYDEMYAGIKTEIRNKTNRFGLLTGIRYTKASSSLGKYNTWASSSDFFYLLNKQEGVNTEYLKVKEINQTSDYLGIPIELRYMLSKKRLFRVFFKVATEINYRINTKYDIVFYNDEMESYSNDVISKFKEPNNFLSEFNLGAGLRIGRDNKINFNIEAALPSVSLTNHSSSLVKTNAGGGFQINILMPIK